MRSILQVCWTGTAWLICWRIVTYSTSAQTEAGVRSAVGFSEISLKRLAGWHWSTAVSENIMSFSPFCVSGVVCLWLWRIQSIANNNLHSHQGYLYTFLRKKGYFKLAGLEVKVTGIVYLKISIIYCHFMDILSSFWWHIRHMMKLINGFRVSVISLTADLRAKILLL